MKKKAFIACLASSLLVPVLFSCNGDTTGSEDSKDSSIEIKNESLATLVNLYNKTTEDDTKVASNFNLTLTRDLYYKGVKRNQDVAAFEGNIFKNNISSLTSKDQSYSYDTKTDSMVLESEKGYYHEFGYEHNLFIDAFYTIDSDGKTLNTLRSSSTQIAEENAKSMLNSGYIDMAGVSNQATVSLDKTTYNGAYDFLTYNYFGTKGTFLSEEAQANAEVTVNGGQYTLTTYFDKKDDQDALYRHLFSFEFTFLNNHLTEVFGTEEEHLVSGDEVSEEISAASSLSITTSFDGRTDSSIDFERYFFTEYEVFLGENPYSVSEVKDVNINTKYFIKTSDAQPASALQNVDKIHLESITKNGKPAGENDAIFDAEENSIQFLKGGDYVLTFVSSNNVRAALEVSLESEDITNLSFMDYDWNYGTESLGYMPSQTIVGEYTVKLTANSNKVTDDTRIELTNNTAGATITKSSTTDLTYTIKATKAGSVTLNAYSEALGNEIAATKTITFFANDDKGIASLLTNATWLPQTSWAQVSAISFTAANETSGSYKATISQNEVTGTYTVSNGKITVTKDEGCTATQVVTSIFFKSGSPNIRVSYKPRENGNENTLEMHN